MLLLIRRSIDRDLAYGLRPRLWLLERHIHCDKVDDAGIAEAGLEGQDVEAATMVKMATTRLRKTVEHVTR